MAWPLSGAWDGATVADLPAIIAALCRGVNERREACALVTVDFLYGDGTVEKAYPSAADYDGFPVSQLGDLVVQLEDQITALAESGYYSVAFQNNTVYTDIADVLAVNGDDPFTGGAGEQHDATIWLRMKRCLDVLVFGRFEIGFALDSSEYSYRKSEDVGTYTVMADAWAAMLSDTPTVDANGAGNQGLVLWVAPILGEWRSTLQDITWGQSLPAYLGTNWLIIGTLRTNARYTTAAYTIAVNATDCVASANNSGNAAYQYHKVTIGEAEAAAFPESVNIECVSSETNPASGAATSTMFIYPVTSDSTPAFIAYLNQSTILTDQA